MKTFRGKSVQTPFTIELFLLGNVKSPAHVHYFPSSAIYPLGLGLGLGCRQVPVRIRFRQVPVRIRFKQVPVLGLGLRFRQVPVRIRIRV